MKDTACISFLQWALPKLNMRWQGFRKVRRQACRRISRRITELHIADIESYRTYLQEYPEEWQQLDSLCRITISRFCRDRGLFDYLGSRVLPALVRQSAQTGDRTIRCLCIGVSPRLIILLSTHPPSNLICHVFTLEAMRRGHLAAP